MFDDALLESRKDHSLGGRRISLPVALGFHALVIAVFVGASAWFTGEAPTPVIAVVFPGPSAGPPPPPLGGGEVSQPPRSNRPHPVPQPNPAMIPTIEQTIAQPVDAHPAGAHPVDAEPVDAGSARPGPDSGPPGPGSPLGVPGGTGPADSTAVGTGASEEILRPGGDVRAPVLLQSVEPEYPEAARRAHLEGTVILEATITASGEVQEIRVLKASNPLLDEAAVRAVRRWRYRPATLSGRAVSVYLTVTVQFHIAS